MKQDYLLLYYNWKLEASGHVYIFYTNLNDVTDGTFESVMHGTFCPREEQHMTFAYKVAVNPNSCAYYHEMHRDRWSGLWTN